ncbi:MAG TPA: site-2 protease family protein [Pirellulales bacterium]|nr:site-2 protease family protein [Pirellulales bacterium]
MGATSKGAVRLFRVAGIDVFVHWSWLVVAWFEIGTPANKYQSPVWNVIEYLSLFAIVTMHEFGHALACRQVGGTANQIMLWPLGGMAFVLPPPRPGAVLWTQAAGPLVNLLLVPLSIAAVVAARWGGLQNLNGDAMHFLVSIAVINVGLLILNLLPIYPLDGGQILQSLLWFVVGRAWSLRIVGVLGVLCGLGLIAISLSSGSMWMIFLSLFIMGRSLTAFRQGIAISRLARAPRRVGFACPSCGAAPPIGDYWTCGHCRTAFDTFFHVASCPGCAHEFPQTQCSACNATHPIMDWIPRVIPEAAPQDASMSDRRDPTNPYASPDFG